MTNFFIEWSSGVFLAFCGSYVRIFLEESDDQKEMQVTPTLLKRKFLSSLFVGTVSLLMVKDMNMSIYSNIVTVALAGAYAEESMGYIRQYVLNKLGKSGK